MLDLRFVRDNLELVKKATESQHNEFDAEEFKRLDEERRSAITKEESLGRKAPCCCWLNRCLSIAQANCNGSIRRIATHKTQP